MGRGSGELASVYRTGGIDHDNRTEPERARWFTPQLLVAAGTIKVAGTTVASAGPVPSPGPIQRNGAVHLDEPARKACALCRYEPRRRSAMDRCLLLLAAAFRCAGPGGER